jgi:hypothetical protein
MNKKQVGEPAKPRHCLMISNCHRFIRKISTRGNDGRIKFLHQEVMKRSVGEHHPQIGIVRRNVIGNLRTPAWPQDSISPYNGSAF